MKPLRLIPHNLKIKLELKFRLISRKFSVRSDINRNENEKQFYANIIVPYIILNLKSIPVEFISEIETTEN